MELVSVGKGTTGKIENIEFGNSTLLCGASGSGKTKFCDNLILNLLRKNSIEQVKSVIVALDPKNCSWYSFEKQDKNGAIRVYKDLKEFSQIVHSVEIFREQRTEQLRQEGLEDIPKNWFRLFLVIDELPAVISKEAILIKNDSEAIKKDLGSILRLGRASGVHLILLTQSTTAEASGLSVANREQIGNRILLKSNSSSEVEQVLGKDYKEDVSVANLIKGESYVKFSSYSPTRVRAPYLSQEQLEQELEKLPRVNVNWGWLDDRLSAM